MSMKETFYDLLKQANYKDAKGNPFPENFDWNSADIQQKLAGPLKAIVDHAIKNGIGQHAKDMQEFPAWYKMDNDDFAKVLTQVFEINKKDKRDPLNKNEGSPSIFLRLNPVESIYKAFAQSLQVLVKAELTQEKTSDITNTDPEQLTSEYEVAKNALKDAIDKATPNTSEVAMAAAAKRLLEAIEKRHKNGTPPETLIEGLKIATEAVKNGFLSLDEQEALENWANVALKREPYLSNRAKAFLIVAVVITAVVVVSVFTFGTPLAAIAIAALMHFAIIPAVTAFMAHGGGAAIMAKFATGLLHSCFQWGAQMIHGGAQAMFNTAITNAGNFTTQTAIPTLHNVANSAGLASAQNFATHTAIPILQNSAQTGVATAKGGLATTAIPSQSIPLMTAGTPTASVKTVAEVGVGIVATITAKRALSEMKSKGIELESSENPIHQTRNKDDTHKDELEVIENPMHNSGLNK